MPHTPGPYEGGVGQWINGTQYVYGGSGASGIIPGSRGGLPAVRVEGDPVNSIAEATDGVRGGGGGSGLSAGANQYPGGKGGDGYLELSWEEDGSWD